MPGEHTQERDALDQDAKNTHPRGVRLQLPDSDATSKPRSPREIGGPKGPEPTRYGDWEKAGRCIDF